MKTNNGIVILAYSLSAILLIAACSNPQANTNNSNNQNTEKTTEPEKEEKLKDLSAMPISDTALYYYFSIKNALVATNADKAKQYAKKLSGFVKSVENATESHQKLADLAEKMLDAKDVEAIRTLFEKMTNPAIQIAKQNSSDKNIYYKQYCPMAFNNEGAAWLSHQKPIRNPYFGDKMLKCGRIDKTIK